MGISHNVIKCCYNLYNESTIRSFERHLKYVWLLHYAHLLLCVLSGQGTGSELT